jgi:hypothetical protein
MLVIGGRFYLLTIDRDEKEREAWDNNAGTSFADRRRKRNKNVFVPHDNPFGIFLAPLKLGIGSLAAPGAAIRVNLAIPRDKQGMAIGLNYTKSGFDFNNGLPSTPGVPE